MTYEEALVYIENTQRTMTKNRGRFASEYIEANGMAILALEKQIPKKPVNCFRCCPICGSDNIEIWQEGGYDYTRFNYCPECGQALDWGETNG